MKVVCFVPSCTNNNDDNPEKLFLTVPLRDKNRRKMWLNAVGLDVDANLATVLHACEDHFEVIIVNHDVQLCFSNHIVNRLVLRSFIFKLQLEQDASNWMYYKTMGNRIVLKKDVVPHKNLHGASSALQQSQLTESAKKRKQQHLLEFHGPHRKVTRNLFINEDESLVFPSTSSLTPTKPATLETAASPSGLFHVQSVQTSFSDKGTQVNHKPLHRSVGVYANMPTHLRLLRTPAKPESPSSGGSSSSETVPSTSKSSEYVPSSSSTSDYNEQVTDRQKTTIVLMESKSRFYLGIPQDVYLIVQYLSEYSQVTYRNVLITLKKIRLNDPYSRLGDDFQLSNSGIQKVFTSSVPQIANVLQELILWPTTATIKKLMPLQFRARYNNVQSIIDCFEVEIEKPSDPVKQAITWSQYKSCNTVKFLISATPNGFVNYVSGAYGGRASDKEIVEESGYLDVLPDGVHVMADRGFKHIAHILSSKQCTLIRPPSVRTGETMSKEEAKRNKVIAALRIHVERVIRRIREFAMLDAHCCLNTYYLPIINYIVIIVCALINVQPPLIS